jgi:hypothetical protein
MVAERGSQSRSVKPWKSMIQIHWSTCARAQHAVAGFSFCGCCCGAVLRWAEDL